MLINGQKVKPLTGEFKSKEGRVFRYHSQLEVKVVFQIDGRPEYRKFKESELEKIE